MYPFFCVAVGVSGVSDTTESRSVCFIDRLGSAVVIGMLGVVLCESSSEITRSDNARDTSWSTHIRGNGTVDGAICVSLMRSGCLCCLGLSRWILTSVGRVCLMVCQASSRSSTIVSEARVIRSNLGALR